MTFESEWARCAPWLEAALKHGNEGYSLDYALNEVREHRATFWPLPDAAVVSELIASDRGPDAHIWLAGGSLRCLLTMTPQIEKRLAASGFTRVTIKGRPGWARALRPMGYRLTGDKLTKELA